MKWFIWSVNLLAYNQILFGMIFPVMFNFVSCTEYKQYLPHNHKLSFWWIQLTARRLAAAADWIMHGQNNNLSENEKKSVALLMAVRIRYFSKVYNCDKTHMIDCDWWVKKLRTSSRKHRALYIFLIMKKIYPLFNNTRGAITAILDLFKTVIQEEFFAWNSLVKLFCYLRSLPIIECQTKNELRKPRALSCKDNSLKENELTNHMIFTVYFLSLM